MTRVTSAAPTVTGAEALHGGPALVDVITQPLQEARAPVSEWIV